MKRADLSNIVPFLNKAQKGPCHAFDWSQKTYAPTHELPAPAGIRNRFDLKLIITVVSLLLSLLFFGKYKEDYVPFHTFVKKALLCWR
jgi:hypothetical protein